MKSRILFLFILIESTVVYSQTKNASWNELGPCAAPTDANNSYTHGTGRIHSIAFDPDYNGNTNKIFYVGSPFGGLWKTIDDGVSWSNVNTDQLPITSVTDIAIDKNNGQHIFIVTGDKDDPRQMYSAGVFRTTDGGFTWENINGTGATKLLSGVLDFKVCRKLLIIDSQTLLLTTSDGVYKTTNALAIPGSNVVWTLVYPSSAKSMYKVMFNPDPAHKTDIYAAGDDIIKSTNGGSTWLSLTSGNSSWSSIFTNIRIDYIHFDISSVSPYYLYALVGGVFDPNNTKLPILYFLRYDWANWIKESASPPNEIGSFAFRASKANANEVFLGELGLYRWNGGATWKNIKGNPVHDDIHALEYSPVSSLFIGDDGGLHRTDNASAPAPTYSAIDNGLCLATVFYLSSAVSDPNIILMGEQDNGCNLYDGTSWKYLNNGFFAAAGDGFKVLIDRVNKDNIYITTYNGHASSQTGLLFNSKDGGDNWNYGYFTSGMFHPSCEPSASALQPLIQDPSDPNILYSSKTDVWKSNDQGVNWKRISDFQNINNPIEYNQFIEALAVSSYDPKIIIAAPRPDYVNSIYNLSRLFITTTGGGTPTVECGNNFDWTDITPPLPACLVTDAEKTSVKISSIATSAYDPNKIWAAYDFIDYPVLKNCTAFKVLMSTNQGITWTDYSHGIDDFVRAKNITYEKGSNDGLYLATDAGVYYRNASMPSWIKFMGSGSSHLLPNVRVMDLEINYTANKLRAGTWGRGVWETKLMCPTRENLSLNASSGTTEYDESYGNLFSTAAIVCVGCTVTYRATQEIDLEDGFDVQALAGSDFRAFIHGCDGGGNTAPLRKSNPTNDTQSSNTNHLDIFNVYPNPTSGTFHIAFYNNERVKDILIYNTMGKQIYQTLRTDKSDLDIDISENSKGIYLIQVVIEGKTYVNKIVLL
jgi:xyloglucan-specific exo-beta-1,4-glucanase